MLIERLLDAWRVTADPRVEAAIVRVGRGIARAKGPIVDASITNGAKLETAWHTAARRTTQAELDRLLDVPWSMQWQAMRARVRVLAQFASDPRIARKLVAIARWHLSKPSFALHQTIVPLLVESVSPSIEPALDALLDARGKHVLELYAPVRAALRSVVRRDADPALIAEAACADLSGVWAEVYAEPDDLARRAVLGDALGGQDDPRGEFIQLQLTDERRARGRASRLLAAHLDEWIGPLPMVERQSVRFARGFPIALVSSAGGPIIARTLDRPEWRTLEELGIWGANCDLAGLLHRMPLLRVLELEPSELATLSGSFPSVRVLCIKGAWYPPPGLFPNLRVLAGTWDVPERAQRLAAELDLHAIVHRNVPLERVAALRNVGPPETRISLGVAPLLQGSGWCIRMWRRTSEVELAWHGGGRADGVERVLQSLVNGGFRAVQIQCADPFASHGFAMSYGVRTCGATITYGFSPFALGEAGVR